jgi:hypothetical protein
MFINALKVLNSIANILAERQVFLPFAPFFGASEPGTQKQSSILYAGKFRNMLVMVEA